MLRPEHADDYEYTAARTDAPKPPPLRRMFKDALLGDITTFVRERVRQELEEFISEKIVQDARPKFVSADMAARRLGIACSDVERLIRTGELPRIDVPGVRKREYYTSYEAIEVFAATILVTGKPTIMMIEKRRASLLAEVQAMENRLKIAQSYRGTRAITVEKKIRIFERDERTCRYCGHHPSARGRNRLELDHVIPWSRGGTNDEDNLVTACHDCNMTKRDLLLDECGMQLLPTPRERRLQEQAAHVGESWLMVGG